ncbi:sugar phosphate isomerase/epimerase [Tateyamaria sp. syn59]|uniref:sugar phosphate isomerase/epimerase family protein n=1 Tax=Tateyamaria sp. syn59 TaxID=2576942 RepID=UPI0011BE8C93|nr:sugar phosphate isomerase/epimerase [Tateyamaria sp. syn59]
MAIRNSVLLGTLGKYSDRFHTYQPAQSFEDRLRASEKLKGAHGVEPVYPQDIGRQGEYLGALKACDLPVSAVNVNIKGDHEFCRGALTNSDPEVRALALDYIKSGMDMAVETGTDMVSVCPLIDGWDHPFEVDYQAQWNWMVEALREAAAHRPEIRVSLEYKPFEVRNRITLGTMPRTLLMCEEVGAKNVGVTMDAGHALIAGESPAAELALAHHKDRLFYVHFNDNDRQWDWDTLPGSVNLWETIETLYWVRRLGWSGWFAYDVFTRKGDPAEALEATFEIMDIFEGLIDKIGMDGLGAMIDRGEPGPAFRDLIKALV